MSLVSSIIGFLGKTIVPSVMAFFPYDIVLITPTPNPTPTPIVMTTPTISPTTKPIFSPTFTLSPTSSLPQTPSPSLKPTNTPTRVPTRKPTLTPTNSPSPTPSTTPTPTNPPVGNPSATQFDTWFTTYSQTYHVDRQKLWQIAVCESNLNPNATNGDYGGLYQFATQTWIATRQQMQADTNPSLRFNPEEAIRTGAYKLSVAGTAPWPACGK